MHEKDRAASRADETGERVQGDESRGMVPSKPRNHGASPARGVRPPSPGCVGGRFLGSRRPATRLVVIPDFDFEGMAFLPLKANPVLLIDPDAVLILSITS